MVLSANLIMELKVWMGLLLWLKTEKIIGLSTQPCVVPVFRMMVDEVWLLTEEVHGP